MHWALRAALVLWLGWVPLGWATNQFEQSGAIQALSAVYFPATQEVYLSIAFYTDPFAGAGGEPGYGGFELAIFFNNSIGQDGNGADRVIARYPHDPLAGLVLRLPGLTEDDPPLAILPFTQSHDGTVVNLRFPLATLGENDGKFAVRGAAGNGSTVTTFAIPAVCDGRPADIVGTAGHDIIYGNWEDVTFGSGGGAAHQVILALAGNDIVYGANDDHICGGPGDDSLHGGNGRDRLFGEDGNDVLYGHGHDDYLNGGPGHDILIGGGSNDMLVGGPGLDVCDGGTGSQDRADATCEEQAGIEPVAVAAQ